MRNSKGSDGLKFEVELGNFENALSRNVRLIRPFVFTNTQSFVKRTMNNIGQPAQPNRELVECAIAEVLGKAHRQGIAPADFVRMLDSGMRMSDFRTAMDPCANADRAIDCHCS
jgi:hypothetical protein